MTNLLQRELSEGVLKLFLDAESSSVDSDFWTRFDVEAFVELARKNVVLLRTYERLRNSCVELDDLFLERAEEERKRVSDALQLIGRISEICSREQLPFVFPKAFQHYPDMGHDVDLLMLDRSCKVDALIRESLGSLPLKGSLCNRIAGKTDYQVNGHSSPVEIHHGCMGLVGENNTYPAILFERRKQIMIDGISTYVPSREDQLIVQVLQRIYLHRGVRVSDILHTLAVLGHEDLDWDYIVPTTKRIGILDGLRIYLSYVQGIHNEVLKGNTGRFNVGAELISSRPPEIGFQNSQYCVPVWSVVRRVYARKFFAELKTRNWESVGKMALLPFLALLAQARELTSPK